jgi:acetyltransferase-like isoleucine patch superfamily enzyme
VTAGSLLAIRRYPEFARLLWWRTIPARLRRAGVEVDVRAAFQGMPIVSMTPNSRIVIGRGATLCSDSRYTALGVNHPVVLRTLRAGAMLTIGADTGVSGGSICAAMSVTIGAGCLIGANVTIVDTDFHATAPTARRHNDRLSDIAAAPVVIEDNVFLGTGAIVLKGVRIGRDSVVGARSVVAHDVPAGVIVGGNPARVLKRL